MSFFTTAPTAWKIPFYLCLVIALGIFAFAPRVSTSEPPKPPPQSPSSHSNTQNNVNSPNSKQQNIENYYEAPKSDEELREIKIKLGRFIKDADPIRQKLFKDRSDLPWAEVQAWEKNVLDYLESTRPDFAVAFESARDRSPLAYANTSPQQTERIKHLDAKVDTLRQIVMR